MIKKLIALAIIIFSGISLLMSCATLQNKSGAVLWRENCFRCHNIRAPGDYNDFEWEVAMFHMRIHASLTVEEHDKVLEFLQQAN